MYQKRLGTTDLKQGWPTCDVCAIRGALDLRSGALYPFDDQKVSHSYSLILVILFFLHVLSSKDNLAF